LLASLQAVNLFWLFLILRIAKNYVMRVGLSDERSDDEEEDEEEAEGEQMGQKMLDGKTKNPALLVNGEPLGQEEEANGEGDVLRRSTRERKKDR
jgi:very-long-chain ceramide synthase